MTITAPNVGHTSTSVQFEIDGLYSDPRYYRDGQKPEATSGTINGENSPKGAEPSSSQGTTKFDITVPDVGRTITSNQSALEMGGLYSDPRYYGEGRKPEATSGTIIGKNSPKGQEPGRSMGATKCSITAPDVGHASTTAQVEVDGLYSDPRYYGEGRKFKATSDTIGRENGPKGAEPNSSQGTNKCNTTAPDVGRTSTSTQSALEMDGYNDPRYYDST